MSDSSVSKTHPLVLTAAGAVVIASGVAIASLTGLISPSGAKPEALAEAPPADVVADTKPEVAQPAAPVRKAAAPTAPRAAPVAQAPAVQAPVVTAKAPEVCRNCGEIADITAIEQKGEGSGLGAIAGGLAGALLGKQVGNGSGQKVAAVAGAIGGAYAGNEVEKRSKAVVSYKVQVRYLDGTSQQFNFDQAPTWRVGDDVKVVNGQIVGR